ncbi:MAG TPA: FMN-binding negative transcriptional regulator [Opitutaceae bacterium]
MYIPAFNRVGDPSKVNEFIQAHGFATLVTFGKEGPSASHLPFLYDEADGGRLRCHMAKANEQWRHFESSPGVLCIFMGPHSYVSPSWYVAKVAVPTWNYAAVHVHGTARMEDDAFLRKTIEDTTAKYESRMPSPWRMPIPEEYIVSMMKAIVGFSIQVTKVEAKFKLGQNRSKEDQLGMLAGLEGSGSLEAQALANFIRAQGPQGSP